MVVGNMKDRLLLSICIPTCNRASYLARTLESLTEQVSEALSEVVEILVSDNFSQDDTESVVRRFERTARCPIRCFRQDHHLSFAENIAAVTAQARGAYIRFHNDTLLLCKGSLSRMVEEVRAAHEDSALPWFLNDAEESTEDCCSVSDLLKKASYYVTWIGAFGIWRSDVDRAMKVFREDRTQIPHTVFLLNEVGPEHPVRVIGGRYFEVQPVQRKGGYNIAEVFGHNYLSLLEQSVANGALSRRRYAKEKRKILLRHINHFYFDLRGEYAFQKTGYLRWLLPHYRWCPYFYWALVKLSFAVLKCKVRPAALKSQS